jgi:hypothetical protein
MTEHERSYLCALMTESWPQRYDDTDLAFWCRKLGDCDWKDVSDAMIEWRNSSKGRFPPGTDEILSLIKAAESLRAKTVIDRTRAMLADERARGREIEGFWQRVERDFQAVIRGLSEEAIAKLRARALDLIPERLRVLFANKDPRRSRTLKLAFTQSLPKQQPPPRNNGNGRRRKES